jgi:hypothetical protein
MQSSDIILPYQVPGLISFSDIFFYQVATQPVLQYLTSQVREEIAEAKTKTLFGTMWTNGSPGYISGETNEDISVPAGIV